MNAPHPAHIDAVARATSTRRICEHEERALASTHVAYNCDQCDARAILDSTDPAVHEALLCALIRHGVLTCYDIPNDPDGTWHYATESWVTR